MRYGIFSDIHANLEAFEAVCAAYRSERIDRFICIGDVVGYGPDPHRCLEKLAKFDCIALAGNHDWGVVDLLDVKFFSPYAKEALSWTKNILTEQDKNFLRKMKLSYSGSSFYCVHGSCLHPERFSYIYNAQDAEHTFKLMTLPLCFVGHTHVPMTFSLKSRRIACTLSDKVSIEPGSKYICNVGSVGQPRDGDNKASYCIYDTKKKLVVINRISYNISKVQNKIRKAGLAEFLAARLSQGR